MNRAAVFLSIRNKATRLPGKSFLPLGGRPLVEQLLARLKRSSQRNLIAITTSTHTDDEVFEAVALRLGVAIFRGSEDDKLDRYLAAARHFAIDVAAIVDGDDPLCDPEYLDRLLAAVSETGADYGTVRDLPIGVASNAVRVDALEKVCRLKTEHDTEVWGGYFTSTGLFSTYILDADAAHRDPELRLTLDYPEDYEVLAAIFDELGPDGRPFTLAEVLALMCARPDLRARNRAAAERYEANLRRITRIGIRREPA
jgi:spore coat polysaccharide biosynthesis protein SpsF